MLTERTADRIEIAASAGSADRRSRSQVRQVQDSRGPE